MLVFVKQGRILSKMEIDRQNRLQFWLRFSANETYPALFHDALQRRPEAWVKRGKDWENYDKTACCGLCKGRPRYYRHANAAGKTIERCGGYTVPIPGASLRDVPEICAMIDRQDRYFAELLDDQPPTR